MNEALVDPFKQLGGYDAYYPGAYTASGTVLEGALNITFTRVSGNPVISGFIIAALAGCLYPNGTTVVPLPAVTEVVVDFKPPALPPGVTVSCA